MQQIMNQPLDDAELDLLSSFLEGAGASAMNIEMLDGFFAALICGADTVLPSEYLPHVFGEAHFFDNHDQASEILGLVMRHWNTIASALFLTLEKDDVYLPVLLEDADGLVRGNDWAYGFMRGTRLRPYSWQELIDSEEFGGAMLPIMFLTHEHDPDPTMRSPEITPDKRNELLMMMIAGMTHIYRYFSSHRQLTVKEPIRRLGRKVGRNELCPCGSGRKYKHCCAPNASKFH